LDEERLDNKSMRKEIDSLRDEVSRLDRQMEDAELEATTFVKRVNEKKQELKTVSEERNSLQSKNAELTELLGREKESAIRRDELEAQNSSLRERVQHLSEEAETLDILLKEKVKKLAGVYTEHVTQGQQLEELERTSSKTDAELEDAIKRNNQLYQKFQGSVSGVSHNVRGRRWVVE
jgi:chromosome segregation ATPase